MSLKDLTQFKFCINIRCFQTEYILTYYIYYKHNARVVNITFKVKYLLALH